MHFHKLIAPLISMLALSARLSAPARAADAPADVPADAPAPAGPRAGERFAAVAPFLDEQTLAVARIDLTRIDPKAIQSWADGVLKGAKADPAADGGLARQLSREMAGGVPAAQAWLDSFTKAGVRDLYVVVNPADLMRSPTYVVPLADGADPSAIERLFAPPETRPDRPHSYGVPERDPSEAPRAEQIGRAVIFSSPAVLKRLRDAKPVDRSDLTEALAAAGDAPLVAALAMPADTRRVVEQLLPKLPPEFGGGNSAAVARGLKWVSVAIRPPPQAGVDLVVRATDARAAKALSDLAAAAGRAMSEKKGDDAGAERLGILVAALLPQVSPERPEELVAKLVGSELERQAAELLAGVEAPRARAMAVRSANNMKQLLLGCVMYAEAHKGEWPADLAQAAKESEMPADVLINPADPDARPGYTYVNPGRQRDIKDAARRLVLYETHPQPAGRGAGFADGHVQTLTEAEFRKYLDAAK